MTADQLLKSSLRFVAARQRRLRLWRKLAICWAVTAALALMVLVIERQSGWALSFAAPLTLVLGILAALILLVRHGRTEPDWRQLAGKIEARYPELDGRL